MVIENLFNNVPYEEARQRLHEISEAQSRFKARRAVMYGTRRLDRSFTEFANEAINWQMNLDDDQLYVLLGA